MNIKEYFNQPDAPARHSPVGQLMLKILERYEPTPSFEEARAEANRLIQKAAGRQNFKLPKIPTSEERRNQAERLARIGRNAHLQGRVSNDRSGNDTH
jgi:hypothetical protein